MAAFGLAGQACGQIHERVLYSFGSTNADGQAPNRLVQAADGCLYGSTASGGSAGVGTLFKVHADGTGYRLLHTFTSNNVTDGMHPAGDIVLIQDGWLCGITDAGGVTNAGTVYKISTNGTGFVLLHSFVLHYAGSGTTEHPHDLMQGSDGALYGTIRGGPGGFGGAVFKLRTDGGSYAEFHLVELIEPTVGLVQGRDGALYGGTFAGELGGGHDYTAGGLFKLNADLTGYATLYAFGPTNAAAPYPASTPATSLIQGEDGALYGTTMWGGSNELGTIFKINTNGTGYTQLYSFTTDGTDHDTIQPTALIQGEDGALYGTTMGGGYSGMGAAFRVSTNGTGYCRLWRFAAADAFDGMLPVGLILGRDGSLYGISQGGGNPGPGTVFRLVLPTGGFATLHTFGAGLSDGVSPQGALVQGPDGTLFGVTYAGGNGGDGTSYNGSGAIFSVNPDGQDYSIPYRFSADGSTGKRPSGVTLGINGGLYGAAGGGSNKMGVLYRVNTNGSGYTLLHTFTTNSTDGQVPSGAPIQGRDGALYGITVYGGNVTTNVVPSGFGTVYTVATNGSNYAVFFRFSTNTAAGAYPVGTLLQATDGALYGAALAGSNGYGCGCIYKLNTNGTGYTVKYNFLAAGGDGHQPNWLIQGSDGWLYGTTVLGGSNDAGTVFRLNLSGGGYAQLHAFSTNGVDGQQPMGIVQGTDGRLYGTTHYGGEDGLGTVFELNTNGTGYAVIYGFTDAEGEGPLAPPIEGRDGALYGTLSGGGTNNLGIVFRLAATCGACSLPSVLPDRRFQFSVNGGALNYRLDASTNLCIWVTLTNVLNTSGPIRITDPNAPSFPKRFYRAVWTPRY